MKIALVQLDHNKKKYLWQEDSMPGLLSAAVAADIVVFPEGMPFPFACRVTIEEAKRRLIAVGKNCKNAFMAGGYVVESGKKRNAVFLVHHGKIKGTYFKRRLYGEPRVTPGNKLVCFKWAKFSCIPLICADAADNPSKVGTTMMYEANQVGAGKNVPIIVCANGGWLMEPYWQVPLQAWASGCEAPVLICGVSGKGQRFEEDGEEGFYGGGGSGVFWPGGQWSDGLEPCQKKEPGIYIVDTDNPEYAIVECARF